MPSLGRTPTNARRGRLPIDQNSRAFYFHRRSPLLGGQAKLKAKCLVEIDRKKLLLTYTGADEPAVSDAIRSLKSGYQVTIDDSTAAPPGLDAR